MRTKKPHRKKREHTLRNRLVLGLVASFFIILLGYAIISYLQSANTNTPETFSFKAAIVDHLSLTAPNPTFKQNATDILQTAGFTVDYYPGEQVTVGFYRNLPTHSYGLIILRVHSAWEEKYQTISLFTSEPYSTAYYVYEQLDERLGRCAFEPYHEGDPEYFGITHRFVQLSMNGRFQKTIIIMMGCNGLETTTMAQAFIDKGARVYISWDKLVSATHTDLATTHLLQHLLIQKQTIKQAVTQTMKDVGPDPMSEGKLLYYPLEAGEHAIQNTTQNPSDTIFTKIEIKNEKASSLQTRKTPTNLNNL